MSHCQVCGTLLEDRELEHEGIIPFCPRCGEFRFPMSNVAVSMIVVNEANRKTLLVKQYGRDYFRELKEETGMTAVRIRFNRTQFFEPSNTLMCNFTAFVKDDSEFSPNYEIDSWAWFSFDEARKNVNPEILAGRFLNACLDDLESSGEYPAGET